MGDAKLESEWAQKREWGDQEFQDGDESNKARLKAFEETLAGRLQTSCEKAIGQVAARRAITGGNSKAGDPDFVVGLLNSTLTVRNADAGEVQAEVLDDPKILGSALDIIIAYCKCYEIDKADKVLETVLPACRKRGGLWLLKALNHVVVIRVKQGRPEDALKALQEIDSTVSPKLSEKERDEAWEFWDITYRNFAWVFERLDRQAEAVTYIECCIALKERVGRPASWFDYWDLGRLKARDALNVHDCKGIQESLTSIEKSLVLHRRDASSDKVNEAKILDTMGEYEFALGYLADSGGQPVIPDNSVSTNQEAASFYRLALQHFKEAHALFNKTVGEHNHLTGRTAGDVSWASMKLGNDADAKKYLLIALETSSKQQTDWGEGDVDQQAPALQRAMITVDRILEVHRRTSDHAGLTKYCDAVERLCKNIGNRLVLSKERSDANIYERLVSSCSLVMVGSGQADGMQRSQKLLQRYMWKNPETAQAQLCYSMLLALPAPEPKGEVDRSS
eukprot:gnl/MRDRNA2_/MRDRNA2_18085_c0_seq1.p1 gnl/MRDRNA2_/MRDRNA2_18085_c0~~gnl/MRDRNA2_/MRDRNA2_18085_c0_seq1.p1  ORF type:complete len:508 (+),score=105.55 gnl/MRDRNA2_/MRDRNA2_18085_c0_seq1:1-1524(+)